MKHILIKYMFLQQLQRNKVLTISKVPGVSNSPDIGTKYLEKALFEKQRQARANSQEIALSIGIRVFRQLQERAAAKARADHIYKEQLERARIDQAEIDAKTDDTLNGVPPESTAAFISAALNDTTRKQIKMSIQQPKKLKRKLTLKSFD